VRLAREAVAGGFHVHIYPEGTVSKQLGTGRNGAAQIARALGLPLIPIGMSGCPRAFLGHTPLPRRGRVTLRVGAAIAPDRDDDDRVTARVMGALASLIDAEHRGDNTTRVRSRGPRAHW
jgi:1-acyl-sn-glycerol-3-phosphate acyltransferase